MVICQSECHTGGTLRDPPDISLQTLRFLNPCLPFQIPIHQLKVWSNRWDAKPPHRALNACASTVQPAKATFQFSVAPFSLPSGRGLFLYYGHGTGLLRLESPGSCTLAGEHPDSNSPDELGEILDSIKPTHAEPTLYASRRGSGVLEAGAFWVAVSMVSETDKTRLHSLHFF